MAGARSPRGDRYLSLTRGDGGQNLIGNELGEGLGVIRTEELLAARRIDGAHQYFTRAYDFGFSKSAAETYTHWPHDSLLGDVVTVVRAFRPHVIVAVLFGDAGRRARAASGVGILARGYTTCSGGHGALSDGEVRGRRGPCPSSTATSRTSVGGANTIAIPVGEYSPILGQSYSEIAAQGAAASTSRRASAQLVRQGPCTGYVYREATRGQRGSTPVRARDGRCGSTDRHDAGLRLAPDLSRSATTARPSSTQPCGWCR